MSTNKALLLLGCVLLFFFVSCSNAEESAPDEVDNTTDNTENPNQGDEVSTETYFTLEVNADYIPNYNSEQENWIIIHDDQGNLLDYNYYTINDELSFEKRSDSIPDNLTITLFAKITREDNSVSFNLQSFPQIEIGSKWIFDETIIETQSEERREQIGSFDFILKNTSPPYHPRDFFYSFSHKFASINQSYAVDNVDDSADFYFNLIPVYEGVDKLLFSKVINDDELRYHFIENIQPNDTIEIAEADLKPFDTYLELPTDGISYYAIEVNAYEEDIVYGNFPFVGYSLYNYPSYHHFAKMIGNIGFLDSFSRYRTKFTGRTQNYYFEYLKYGERPNTFDVPIDGNLIPNNTSLSNFTFSTDISYAHRRSSFFVTNTFNNIDFSSFWAIYSGENQFPIIGSLPNEILENYPEMDIENLDYYGTALYLDLSLSYNELIQQHENPELKEFFQSEVYAWFYYE